MKPNKSKDEAYKLDSRFNSLQGKMNKLETEIVLTVESKMK